MLALLLMETFRVMYQKILPLESASEEPGLDSEEENGSLQRGINEENEGENGENLKKTNPFEKIKLGRRVFPCATSIPSYFAENTQDKVSALSYTPLASLPYFLEDSSGYQKVRSYLNILTTNLYSHSYEQRELRERREKVKRVWNRRVVMAKIDSFPHEDPSPASESEDKKDVMGLYLKRLREWETTYLEIHGISEEEVTSYGEYLKFKDTQMGAELNNLEDFDDYC